MSTVTLASNLLAINAIANPASEKKYQLETGNEPRGGNEQLVSAIPLLGPIERNAPAEESGFIFLTGGFNIRINFGRRKSWALVGR
jgi:hypothetical protein